MIVSILEIDFTEKQPKLYVTAKYSSKEEREVQDVYDLVSFSANLNKIFFYLNDFIDLVSRVREKGITLVVHFAQELIPVSYSEQGLICSALFSTIDTKVVGLYSRDTGKVRKVLNKIRGIQQDGKIAQAFYKLTSKYSDADRLVRKLSTVGELLLIGGTVRDYFDNKFKTPPRDIDIVLKCFDTSTNLDKILKDFSYTKNSFGGYKLKVANLEFDIWKLEDTWAFKESRVKCLKEDYEKRLQDTQFLNIDSAVYNLSSNILYASRYKSAMSAKELDVVLEDNKFLPLQFVRALIFSNKYNTTVSPRLRGIIKDFISSHTDYLDLIYHSQLKHYGFYKISWEDINSWLHKITD